MKEDLQQLSGAISGNFGFMQNLVLDSLNHDQAEEVVVLDIAKRSNFACLMVLASGKSGRHVLAMTTNLMEKLKSAGFSSSASGLETANWVLVDVGDIVVNLFLPESRAIYKLEELWGAKPAQL